MTRTCELCHRSFPGLATAKDAPDARHLVILTSANPHEDPTARVTGYLAVEGSYCKPCFVRREDLAGGPR